MWCRPCGDEMDSLKRSRRHLGTYYYVGTLFSHISCGHKHATVKAALPCRRKFAKPLIFMAHLGLLPAKILD